MYNNKPSIVCVSQDPDSIFSYGLQVGYLINATKDLYDWNVISSQYTSGNPIQRDGFTKWANEGMENRCTTTLRKVIEITNPFCVFSMGDIHHHDEIRIGKPQQIPWVSWFPWDNHDPNALLNNAGKVLGPDIKVTMSDFAENFLTKYGMPPDEKIYNIVDVNTFKPNPDIRKTMNINNKEMRDKYILLFVGRLNWRKNIEFLLTSFKEITRRREDVLLYLHVNLDEVGAGGPNISKLIHGLGLNNKVIITQTRDFKLGVTTKRLNDLYNLCDLYFTTHEGEGFGLPICEAMAAGKPFIATNCTTTKEFSGSGQRGIGVEIAKQVMDRGVLRPWVNVDLFVEETLNLLNDPEEMNEMGKRGRKWVSDNYSLEAVVPKWIDVFNRLDVPRCRVRDNEVELDWKEMARMPGVF